MKSILFLAVDAIYIFSGKYSLTNYVLIIIVLLVLVVSLQ